MSQHHFVVAGLAHARAPWFSRLASWATGGVVPVEFVKCVSTAELRTRLDGTRRYSAVFLDAGMPGIDRDLLEAVARTGAAAIVVAPPGAGPRWTGMGATAIAEGDLVPDDVVGLLRDHATPSSPLVDGAGPDDAAEPRPAGGQLVAVTGPGGTGASVIAGAVASGLAANTSSSVLLADLALRADQAMLHDSREVIPGVQELVEAHRTGTPRAEEVVRLTFDVPGRGYHLLLGLRRARDWTAIRPRALHAALDSVLGCFDTVVADISPDVDGEQETGSADVEDRHLLARASLRRATCVVVTSSPTMKGTYSLARVVGDLVDIGVETRRILPVVNHAPRNPHARSEVASALAALTSATPSRSELAAPVFVPPVRSLERALRDGTALPRQLVRPVTAAATSMLHRFGGVAAAGIAPTAPERVTPGTVGAWSDDDEAVA